MRDNGLDYPVEQITVGCGAKQVIFNALFASLDPGDEVIIPTPCWVSYPEMVRLAGGTPVLVPCSERLDYKLEPEALAAMVTPRSKWLMLNSPQNPTGSVQGAADLERLAEVLRRHPRLWVLADDIYEKLVYAPAVFATMAQAAPDLAERTLIVNGVSKASCMTGWRVGYGAGPAELIKAMNTIQGQTTSHTSSISQAAAVEAIGGDQTHVADFVAEFRRRRDLVVERLNRIPGLRCPTPEGAFYAFPDCSGVIGRRTVAGAVLATDRDFADYLLETAGVAVLPGSSFLASEHLRISFAASRLELKCACENILAACADLR